MVSSPYEKKISRLGRKTPQNKQTNKEINIQTSCSNAPCAYCSIGRLVLYAVLAVFQPCNGGIVNAEQWANFSSPSAEHKILYNPPTQILP